MASSGVYIPAELNLLKKNFKIIMIFVTHSPPMIHVFLLNTDYNTQHFCILHR